MAAVRNWPQAVERFDSLGIHAPSQLLKAVNRPGEIAVALVWSPAIPRSMHVAGWYVVQQGVPTDPTGPWYHAGNKFFPKEAKDEAIRYVQQRYGYSDWVSIPGFKSDLFPDWVKQQAYLIYKRAPQPPKLKVYGYTDVVPLALTLYDTRQSQVRCLVAAKSLAEVRRVTGRTEYSLRQEGDWTGNDEEIAAALDASGQVIFRPLNAGRGTPWTVHPSPKE